MVSVAVCNYYPSAKCIHIFRASSTEYEFPESLTQLLTTLNINTIELAKGPVPIFRIINSTVIRMMNNKRRALYLNRKSYYNSYFTLVH